MGPAPRGEGDGVRADHDGGVLDSLHDVLFGLIEAHHGHGALLPLQ